MASQHSIKQWSWIAFFFPQLFALVHRLWILLLISLIPFVIPFVIFRVLLGSHETYPILVLLIPLVPFFITHVIVSCILGTIGLKEAWAKASNHMSRQSFEQISKKRVAIILSIGSVYLAIFALFIFLSITQSLPTH